MTFSSVLDIKKERNAVAHGNRRDTLAESQHHPCSLVADGRGQLRLERENSPRNHQVVEVDRSVLDSYKNFATARRRRLWDVVKLKILNRVAKADKLHCFHVLTLSTEASRLADRLTAAWFK